MNKKLYHCLLALTANLILLLTACGFEENTIGISSSNTDANSNTDTNSNTNFNSNSNSSSNSNALTWTRWNGFDNFLEQATVSPDGNPWE